MLTADIKNLAIALEAISRINGAVRFRESINNLLQAAIVAKTKENNPARTYTPTTSDDDIPF